MARPDSLNGGARVTDEERSRAVAELRKASTGAYRHVDALDVIAGSVGVDADGKFDNEVEKETYSALADLIDRPTCHDVGGGYEFRCSACGCVIHIFRDGGFGEDDSAMTVGGDSLYVPHYCPNCGAEVVEEGGCDVPEL